MGTVPDKFISFLKEQGLIEKAITACASWQNGYIAQDEDGKVYAYNGKIKHASSHSWYHFDGSTLENNIWLITKIAKSKAWDDHYLPIMIFLEPVTDLTAMQQDFLKYLISVGVDKKIKQFIDACQTDSWVAMDASGVIFLYIYRPRKRPDLWCCASSETAVWFRLGQITDHQLNWETCLVSLNQLKRLSCPTTDFAPDIIDRADCWI